MKYKILVGIIALIFLFGVGGSVLVLSAPTGGKVELVSDGQVVRTVDLHSAADEVFSVTYNGKTNTIEIKDGKIRVADAECPDRTCVHMGWLKGAGVPIVCLPNHLVIRTADAGDVDAVAG